MISVNLTTMKNAIIALFLATTINAQDPLRLLPNNYRVIFENDTVRVIHVIYRPHEKLAVHAHPSTPTLYAYLSDSGPVRFSHVEEKEKDFSIVRKPLKAGTFRLSPGRAEVHDVENLGDIPSEFLRIELRKVPLGFQKGDFRDTEPVDLTTSHTSVEFRGPSFRIDRIVAVPGHPIAIQDIDKPSLIVPFTQSTGNVHWLAAHEQLEVKASGSPNHLLRIVFD